MWFMSSTFEYPGIPYIFTVWDLAHKYFPYLPEIDKNGSGFERREIFYENSLSKAAIIVTGTNVGKSDIINFYRIPDERIKVVPFPTPKYILGSKVSETIDPQIIKSRDFIFYPAQFWAHKNHTVILLALKILKQKFGKTINVVFTGSDQGHMDFILAQIKKLELEDQAYSLGFVKHQQLITLYKEAKMLVFPTFFGPDNIPPLEAFALSCPVVASNIPGAKEQLGDAALLFDPTNENELAECILSVLEDDVLRANLIAKGLRRAISWTSSDYKNKVLLHIDELKSTLRLWKNI
jgi:glycosyltransferase involved in cell wall biosynthesis